jgi:hypothetical protein
MGLERSLNGENMKQYTVIVKLFGALTGGVKAIPVRGRRGSQVFYTFGSYMAVRLSTLRAVRLLLHGDARSRKVAGSIPDEVIGFFS